METIEPTNAELVAETLSGCHEAYGLLYDRYSRFVRAVLCAVGTPFSEVEDLTQETFLRAYRKLETLTDPEKFRPCVAGIARLVAQEQRRSSGRDKHVFVGLAD